MTSRPRPATSTLCGFQLISMIMGLFCAVFGCSHNKKRDKQFAYFRFPTVIKNQGKQTKKLSRMRRKKWIANISRADLTKKKVLYSRVCSVHFISGKLKSKLVILYLRKIPFKILEKIKVENYRIQLFIWGNKTERKFGSKII